MTNRINKQQFKSAKPHPPLHEMLINIRDHARKIFVETKKVDPVLFFRLENNDKKVDGENHITPVSDFMNRQGGKDILSSTLRLMAQKMNMTEFVLVHECWMKQFDTIEASKAHLKSDQSLADLPDKSEVIMVNYSTANRDVQIYATISRAKDAAGQEIVTLGDWQTHEDRNGKDSSGRFSSSIWRQGDTGSN